MLRTLVAAGLLVLALANVAPARSEDDPPIDCTNAMATHEMNACAEKDLEKADAELNAVYKKALAAIPEMATDEPYDAKSWETALRESQRAWVAFRDAECSKHVPMFWTGGSGATVEILGCIREKTEARTKELKERYEPDDSAESAGKETPAR